MEFATVADAGHSERHSYREEYADAPVNFSQIRRPTRLPLRTRTVDHLAAGTMTPPLTPTSTIDGSLISSYDEPAVFHNYLRASFAFDPSTTGPGAEVQSAATMKPGDLVLVHSVHANGWADGTVLTTGVRGWLPTNYCEPFTHPYMAKLLNATRQLWDLLSVADDETLSVFVRHDYIPGLIAGVRSLLRSADCLHRDAWVIKRHAGIRRMRRGLLADLSSLVKIAQRLQQDVDGLHAAESVHVLLHELMPKALRVITRAVGFLDMWTSERPAPRRDYRSKSVDSSRGPASVRSSMGQEPKVFVVHGECFDNFDLPTAAASPTSTRRGSKDWPNAFDGLGPDQKQCCPNNSQIQESADPRSQSSFVARRLSSLDSPSMVGSPLASRRLATAHDACISRMGEFVGKHMHLGTTGEPVGETTDGFFNACQALLDVVDQVIAHNQSSSAALGLAREGFKLQIDELIQCTRDALAAPIEMDVGVNSLSDRSSHLTKVGASLMRKVIDCVNETRSLIQQKGDFNVDESTKPTFILVEGEDEANATAGADAHVTAQTPSINRLPPSLPQLFFHKRGASEKMLPAIPPSQPSPLRPRAATDVNVVDYGMPSPASTLQSASPVTPSLAEIYSRKSLPPVPITKKKKKSSSRPATADASAPTPSTSAPAPSTIGAEADDIAPATETEGENALTVPEPIELTEALRKTSFGTSTSGSFEVPKTHARDSGATAISSISTRATTPDQCRKTSVTDTALMSSFDSVSSLRSAANADTNSHAEAQILQESYAHELTFNMDGQVSLGTVRALVDKLTPPDEIPDAQFLSAFLMTFRGFATARELVELLVKRFDSVGQNELLGAKVRPRIYNVFKGWLETYWHPEDDRDALGDVRYFAKHKLNPVLPQLGEKLIELTRRLAAGYSNGTLTGPLVSGVGKISTSLEVKQGQDASATPNPVVTKSHLSLLRNSLARGTLLSITEMEPLEVARQLTILASQTFISIRAEELLNLEWTRKDTKRAQNVGKMTAINTELAYVVADTIMTPETAKKRALVIKHWSKIAKHCLELDNYDSLMAILCSLEQSAIRRLHRTWALVSEKSTDRLKQLKVVTDLSRNYSALRERLREAPVPCIPFLGMFLSDLIFIHQGNESPKDLPNVVSDDGKPTKGINFDRYRLTARTISQIQRFQTPHNLQAVPEMQDYLRVYMARMREDGVDLNMTFYNRSLLVEPRAEGYRSGYTAPASGLRSGSFGASDDAHTPATPGETISTPEAVLESVEDAPATRPKTAMSVGSENGSNNIAAPTPANKFELLVKTSLGLKSSRQNLSGNPKQG